MSFSSVYYRSVPTKRTNKSNKNASLRTKSHLQTQSTLAGSVHPVAVLTGLMVAVAFAVFVAHWPALSAKAIAFDDFQYLTKNKLVQNPSWASAGRFLTEVLEPSTVGGYYQPLAMISLMLDHAMGGSKEDLSVFHRTSLVLHVCNTLLVIVLLYRLFGEPWVAGLVGALFGVHPMTVEPIPWVAERKTLVATFFALGCLIAYVRYARTSSWKAYVVCFVMYVSALMSKPTSTMLPVCMLVMDFWPLGRLNRKAVLEKIPFFMIGGISAIITFISQERTASVIMPRGGSPVRIPLTLCHNIIFYLHKMVWPTNLTPFCDFPRPFNLSHPALWGGVVGSCVWVVLLCVSLRWTRAIAAGWLFFFAAIFPTLGVVGFTSVIASDKYAYLPAAGLLMTLAWFLVQLWRPELKWKAAGIRRMTIILIVVFLAGIEMAGTRSYLHRWWDSETIYRHMLRLAPNASPVHTNIGSLFHSLGKHDEAIFHLKRSIELFPHEVIPYYNLGNVFSDKKEYEQAKHYYRRALEVDPNYNPAYTNLGSVSLKQGRLDEAIQYSRRAIEFDSNDTKAIGNLGAALITAKKTAEAIPHFRHLLQLEPNNVDTYTNLAAALNAEGKFDEATACFQRVLAIAPHNAVAMYGLANTLMRQGRTDEAIEQYRSTLQVQPDYAEAHNNLGSALILRRRFSEAVDHCRQALRIKPDYATAHANLGIALRWVGRLNEALAHSREALRLYPGYPHAVANIAWILATHPDAKVRDPIQAVHMGKRLSSLAKHKNAIAFDILAAAYASMGQFDQAVSTLEKALKLVSANEASELVSEMRKRLELYQQGQPYREKLHTSDHTSP